MEGKQKRSHRPLIIVGVIFVIAIIIVGAVVWKVTKDTYEGDDNVSSKSVGDNGSGGGNKSGNGNGDGKGDGDGGGGTDKEITEEELRRSPWKRLRLPRNILPVNYDITMYPDIYDGHAMYYGNETILLNVTSPSKYLFIHVNTEYMSILDSSVFDSATDKSIAINRTFTYEPNQFFVIEAEKEFTDLVKVYLQFEGPLNKTLEGIYKASYVNSLTNETRSLRDQFEGHQIRYQERSVGWAIVASKILDTPTRYMATSKFEPTFARRAFPCLDEPNMKATFTITLIHRGDYIALSNMDVQAESNITIDNQQLLATHFNQSVVMSTYLVCFIVCDFKYISTESKRKTKIRVFATPDKVDQIDYALEMANYTLNLYEDVFEIHYPMPKQDLIAIPDFVSGAMEHWGLITFRETRILYNSSTSTLASKKNVAATIAHEMAHQWFGNLVTMDWWNDLWLNEGFASYMEYLGVEDKEIDMDMKSQFIKDDLLRAMSLDDVINTHPIVVNVKDPAEITSVFDTISYSKGASVIRMLYGIMGQEKFFKGIAHYLKKYEWGNAKTDDLWQSLTEVDPSIQVKWIMDTWTIQDGYPYVNITMKAGKDSTTFEATQHRFMSDPNAVYDPANSPYGYKWYINLDYEYSLGTGSNVMNRTSELSFNVPHDLSNENAWIKFNRDKTGFYRVLYPEELWYKLANYLSTTNVQNYKLSASDRADILSDAFELAAAGKSSYDVALTLVQYLKNGEDHYVPWSTASGGLSYISKMLRDDPDYEIWKNFRLDLIKAGLDVVKEDDTHFLKRQLYSLLFSAAGRGMKTVSDDIQDRFNKWVKTGEKPPIYIREVVYSEGVATDGTNEVWNFVWDKYISETSPSEKWLLLLALSSTRTPNLIAKFLDRTLRLEGIKRQDFFLAVRVIGNNNYARHMVWEWMQKNYGSIEKMFKVTSRSFGRMAYYFVKDFKTPLKLQEVKRFFSQHPNEGSSTRYRKMALESINKNIQWLDQNRDDILKWVKMNGKK